MDSAAQEKIISDLKERKAGTLEELVNAHTGALLAACFAMGFSRNDAEELAQSTFTAFLTAAPRFEGRSKIKTYLFGILYHKASDLRRDKGRQHSLDALREDFGERFDLKGQWIRPPAGPEEAALNGEIQALIEECARGLSLDQKAAFFLKEAEGESSEDICNILGVSYTNLRVIMHRAKMKLRDCLEKKWELRQ